MRRYEVPLQENGRLILPAELRRMLGVDKGDRVVIQADGERIELTTARRSRARARERMRQLFPDARGVVDEFLAERRAEARREEDGLLSDDQAPDDRGQDEPARGDQPPSE